MARDTSNTQRRGYERPEQGADWATAWDALVEDQDEIVVERDTVANRPASGDYDGELFLATDEQLLYQWDETNSTWGAIAGAGSSSARLPKQFAESTETGGLFIGPSGSLLKITASGGDNGFLQLGDIGDLKELRLPGETELGGTRIVDEMEDQNGNGGIPGVEMRTFTTQNHAVALRPADQGNTGLWWDRSDGSKEWAIKVLSAQSGSRDDEQTPIQVLRALDMSDGGAVKYETFAPDSGVSRGNWKFRDDFLGDVNPRWTKTETGNGVEMAGANLESTGGAGNILLSTGTSSGDETKLDFGGAKSLNIDHFWKLRMAYRGNSDTNVEKRWGLRVDASNYIEFFFDDVSSSVQAETASGGTTTTTDTGAALGTGGEFGCEIVNDPYNSEVRFKHSDARGEYPSYVRFDQNQVTISTNIPSGAAEPLISVTTNEAAEKDWKLDYFWVEGERVPHTRNP